MYVNTPESLRSRIGQEVGLSPWLQITQEMVNRFADLTGDHQFIHVDAGAAAQTPFKGTVAHGFLILSMIAQFSAAADFLPRARLMGVNYGFDRVRLVAPVRTGSRIRGRFLLKELTGRGPGQWLLKLAVTIEIEGQAKPAVVADWLALQYANAT